MQASVFSTKPYERNFLQEANIAAAHRFSFHEPRLTAETAQLAAAADAVCIFVNDVADADTLSIRGTGLV